MTEAEVARILLQIEAIKVRIDPPFKWVSGILSPVYCDNRMIISFPQYRRQIVDAFKQIIVEKSLVFDVIGGTATAAIPWAAFLAYELDKPMIYIRPEPKEHGRGKQIEGYLEPGKQVLIVEDLISTGSSSVKAAQAVRDEGTCQVKDVLAIVSWELLESLTAFESVNIKLHNLTDFTSIIGEAVKAGYLSEDQREEVLRFKDDPRNWGILK